MITDVRGDLLSDGAEAIVKTVNTKGVMGKGIALQFKLRYPDNYKAYRAACTRGEVRLGLMFVVPTGALDGPRYIINFREAQDFLDERPEMVAALDRVTALIEDFDSPYGLELLSTVHWVIQADGVAADDDAAIAGAVRSWSERKSQLLTDHHVVVARDWLAETGWIDVPEPARSSMVV